jgi:non-ribosomal peptide synthetase component F
VTRAAGTAPRYPTATTLLERRVREHPDAVAVVGDGAELTYAQLWGRAGELGSALREAAAGPGRHIAILAHRSVEAVVAVVAASRAACVLLPLDVDAPPKRLQAQLEDLDAAVVVGHADRLELLPALSELRKTQALRLAAPAMHHGGLAHMLSWFLGETSCGPGARTLQSTPLHFDVSLQEIFGTLCGGGTLVCCTEAQRADPALLWELIVAAGVHRIHLPFALLQLLALFADDAVLERCVLREVCCGGEQLQCTKPVKELFRRLPRCTLFNHYGASEAWMLTSHRLPQDADSWPVIAPIGRPVPDAHLHICDEDSGVILPPGESGELVAGGPSTGPGYWRRPALTAERFVPDRCGAAGRVYRTGDVVRMDADGVLTFLGRRDTQIKLRGNRIEVGELEVFLNSQPDVTESVVVATGEDVAKRLEAFVVPTVPGVEQVLFERLEAEFPPYMVPSRIRELDRLPRTPTGKADRRLDVLAEAADARRREAA